MFTSAPCLYSVNKPARSICAQRSSKEKHRFLVGTCSVKEKNEIHLLNYDEDANNLDSISTFQHTDQVWVMESSPRDASLIITSAMSKTGTKSVSLWKLPLPLEINDDDDDIARVNSYSSNVDAVSAERVSSFQLSNTVFVNAIHWHNTKDQILTSDPKNATLWTIRDGHVEELSSFEMNGEGVSSQWCGGGAVWDPHNSSSAATAVGSQLYLLDTRKMTSTAHVKHAHHGNIRDVDYNPNKPLTLLTTGDDQKIKFWDVRNMKCPVRTIEGHSHWIYTAKYNPFHDQLIVSGGSDNLVNLWRVASCSSAPWLGGTSGDGDDDASSDPPDIRIRAIEHEESVYGVAWSPAEAWMFCSLSYEGRVTLNHVPSTEKYKILL